MLVFTLQVLPGRLSVFLLVAGPQVTLGVFDLKPGLLFDGRSQRVFIHAQKRNTRLLIITIYAISLANLALNT